jgi:hypothetical protein
METLMRCSGRLCGPLAALFLCACAAHPILPYRSEVPAQILTPVHAAGIKDGRGRFREIFCQRVQATAAPAQPGSSCADYLHRLADEPAPDASSALALIPLQSIRFVVVPGFLSDAAPADMRTLGPSIDALARKGYRIEYLQVSGGGGADYNGAQIAAHFRQRAFPDDEKLVVIGHSKGAMDVLHFLVGYPQLARQVDAMVAYVGAINGSPLAEVYPELLVDMAIAMRGSDGGDRAGYRSLTPSVQMTWLAGHALPAHVRYFSLAAFTARANVSSGLVHAYDRLAEINPRNDGQLIFYDQIIPGSTLLGYANGDHWAVAMPFAEEAGGYAFLADKNDFPRDTLFEAVLLYVRESL